MLSLRARRSAGRTAYCVVKVLQEYAAMVPRSTRRPYDASPVTGPGPHAAAASVVVSTYGHGRHSDAGPTMALQLQPTGSL